MSEHVYIIAEAGVNHNGELNRALAMVEVAADARADAIKFQTFCPKGLVTQTAPQADYQIRNTGDTGSQLAMLQGLALSKEDHHALQAHCAQHGIDFLSSPFDLASADFLLNDLRLSCIKLGSGELTNGPLLLHVAHAGCKLILSTGMATLDEVREALGVLAFGYLHRQQPRGRADFAAVLENPDAWSNLRDKLTLLHCTTEYPCPPEQVNLHAMDTLESHFGLPVGYSDHSQGVAVAVAAAARGASVLEKHFTLSRELQGPDHAASLEPNELSAMVEAIRTTSLALGNPQKTPSTTELGNARVARKSLVAAANVPGGTTFDSHNLTTKRPGTGRSPMDYWDVLGTAATHDYQADEVIK